MAAPIDSAGNSRIDGGFGAFAPPFDHSFPVRPSVLKIQAFLQAFLIVMAGKAC
jgi:hypothetical protein